ncbi:MAG: arsenate reductase [Acidobacteria bacterium]|nr:arsenate reductase [Acidobacteriota bacterium]
MAVVQIFGVKNSAETRAAERFFKERRAEIQMVDLTVKPMAAGEINRFIQRFTLNGLLDAGGKAYQSAGIAYLRLTEPGLLARIAAEPRLLKLPLVRCGNLLSLGRDEAAWKTML